jgi:DNA-binding CsgD family transcriptional regulator
MTDLTAREDEVLRLAVQKLSNDEIAARLNISRRTVEAHLRTLFRKTGVTSRSQLAMPAGPVAAAADRLAQYDAVLRSLVDRHLSLFEERVEITFTVGARGDADTVVERRWTVPTPFVVYRTSRPLVGPDWLGRGPGNLGLTTSVAAADVEASVSAVIEPDRRPLAVVLFRPGLSEQTEWTLSYTSEGLWDPLRDGGSDRFGWSTVTSGDGGGHRPTVVDMAFRLVFPAGWSGIGLAEQSGVGVPGEVVRRESGQQEITWRDSDPTAPKYEFSVTGTLPH